MKRIGCALAASLMILAGCGSKSKDESQEPSELPSEAPVGGEGETTPAGDEAGEPSGTEEPGDPSSATPGDSAPGTGAARGGAATPGAAGTAAPRPSMSKEEIVRRTGDLVEAFNQRERERASTYYTESTVTRMIGYQREWTGGRENIERFFESTLWTSFPDLQITPQLVLVDGLDAIVVLHATGTNSGPIMGRQPTKRKVGIHALWHVRLTPDGRIAQQEIVFDPVTVLAQLRLSPLPARAADLDGWPAEARKTVLASDSAAEEANAARVRQLVMTMDPKQNVAHLAEEIVVHDMAMPADVKGHKAMARQMDQWSKAFSEPRVIRSELFAAGDYVVAILEHEAVNTGAVPGLKAKKTNQPVKMTSYCVFRLEDAKVAEVWTFSNAMELLDQLNVSPTTGKQQRAARPASKPPGQRAAR